MAGVTPFEGWGIIEIFGHRKAAGFIREVSLFGAQMAAVDIPESPAVEEQWEGEGANRYRVRAARPAIPAATQFYGGGSIFSMTPTTEQVARAAVERFRRESVTEYPVTFHRALPPATQPPDAEVLGDDGACDEGAICVDPDCRRAHPEETT
jgi:hypothetical protein